MLVSRAFVWRIFPERAGCFRQYQRYERART